MADSRTKNGSEINYEHLKLIAENTSSIAFHLNSIAKSIYAFLMVFSIFSGFFLVFALFS